MKEGSPAEKAGLANGDVIKSLASVGEKSERVIVNVVDDVLKFDKEHAGEEVYISYQRDENTILTKIELNSADSEYILGAGISGEAVYKSTWSAPIVGAGVTLQITGETFKGVGEMLYRLVAGVIKQINFNEEVRTEGVAELEAAGNSVSGPVGIVGVLFPNVARSGGRNLAYLVALISVSLACMNVLPIPALDGGRWLLIAIYKIRKKKLTKEKEEKIVSRAFIVIIAIALIVTILDITRIVR